MRTQGMRKFFLRHPSQPLAMVNFICFGGAVKEIGGDVKDFEMFDHLDAPDKLIGRLWVLVQNELKSEGLNPEADQWTTDTVRFKLIKVGKTSVWRYQIKATHPLIPDPLVVKLTHEDQIVAKTNIWHAWHEAAREVDVHDHLHITGTRYTQE